MTSRIRFFRNLLEGIYPIFLNNVWTKIVHMASQKGFSLNISEDVFAEGIHTFSSHVLAILM